MIPFSPPRIDKKTVESVKEALLSGWITTGPKTKLFEEELARYIGSDYITCLNSATAGLQIILRWLGVKEGDEVIVPAYTYCATANVVLHTGAKPVMVDSLPNHPNMDPLSVDKAITSRTKAIIAVDVAGMPANYDELKRVITGRKYLFEPRNKVQGKLDRIMLISDAAHSIGAAYKGKKTGNQADMSSFSFHAVKNLTTAEGGAVAFNVADKFNHQELQKRFKTLSLHGQTKDALAKTKAGGWKYDIVEAGFKCNMTDLQAAIGLVELDRYEETLQKRAEIFQRYEDGFKDCSWAILPEHENDHKKSSYHLFMLRIKDTSEVDRDLVIDSITEQLVAVNVHYRPLPMLTLYKELGFDMDDYPNAYNLYRNEISLPVYYDLTEEQIETVIRTVKTAVTKVLDFD